MELNNIINPDSPWNLDGEHRWKETSNFLQILQEDVRNARRQLEQVNLQLAEKEALINEHLRSIISPSPGCNTLRLVKYSVGSTINRMGNSVLGGVARPTKVPLPAKIEIHCLGRFEARSALAQIGRWHSVKAKSVFQYLLVKPHEPTLKDALIEALWPGGAVQSSNNNLKAAVHSLRINLSELTIGMESQQIILFSEGSYRLNPEVSLSIDVEEFEKCRANGRRLEKERRITEAMSEFEKAEVLYRGDYLEDEPYEEWTLLKREALKDNYLIILSKLAEYCLKTFNYEDCISYSQKILAKDQCREDAYRNLIHCHLMLNQKNRALRWYEICCQTIKTEMDTIPEKETMKMGERILNHQTSGE
jgi:DNA-binding SARP family transcriptional activator